MDAMPDLRAVSNSGSGGSGSGSGSGSYVFDEATHIRVTAICQKGQIGTQGRVCAPWPSSQILKIGPTVAYKEDARSV
jgi:hypothetical protein